MQSKINQSQESVFHVQSQVHDTVHRLESMESRANIDIEKMEAEMESLIIAAQ